MDNPGFADILIIISSLFLLAYSSYRAAVLSFTIDESISYNSVVPLSFYQIITYEIASANHHLLNSICMKLSSMVFGPSEFALRLHSVISHVIYILFTYKILKKNCSPVILLAGFLLLNFNPYMLDFFSLARGYAMAVAMTVVCIYYFLSYIKDNTARNLIFSLISGIIAVLSNFSLLVFYLSLVVVINIYWISSGSFIGFKTHLKKNIPVALCTLILGAIIFLPLKRMIHYGELYDGGTTGFWYDTVGSLISATFYGKPLLQKYFQTAKYFVAISSAVMLIYLSISVFLKKQKAFRDNFSFILLLLAGPCLISIIQHYFIGSNYLINRMGLFLIPLFSLALIFFFNDFDKLPVLKYLNRAVITLLAVVFVSISVIALNTSYALYWKFDSKTKNMMSDLERSVLEKNGKNVRLGVTWLLEPSVNFYRQIKNYDWLEKVTYESYTDRNYDYYYLADSDMNYIRRMNLQLIKFYKESNTALAKSVSVAESK
jgi:hypothetical protein